MNIGTMFDDLEDGSFDGEIEHVSLYQRAAEVAVDMPAGPQFKERCAKCFGSGQFRHLGACFACKGAGYKTFRTAPDQRAKARLSAARTEAKKAQSVAEQAQAWTEANPELHAWMTSRAPRFDFAASMVEALAKFGALTEKQAAAVERLAAADKVRDEARAAEKAQAVAAAPAVEVAAIEQAFATARASGIKSPKLRLAGFRFSAAPATGQNAGAIYVKAGDDYLGKIVGGKFRKVFTCQPATEAEVLAVAADPKQTAIAYGKQFGQCAICAKELSDPVSIERGIGPKCASRFDW